MVWAQVLDKRAFHQNSLLKWCQRWAIIRFLEFDAETTTGATQVGKTDRPTGTKYYLLPRPHDFKETIEFDYKWVVDYLRHQAHLTKVVYVAVRDERSKERAAFYFEGGIQAM